MSPRQPRPRPSRRRRRWRAGEGERARGRTPRMRSARRPAARVLWCGGGGKMAAPGGSAGAAALRALVQQFTAITGAFGARAALSPPAFRGTLPPGPHRRRAGGGRRGPRRSGSGRAAPAPGAPPAGHRLCQGLSRARPRSLRGAELASPSAAARRLPGLVPVPVPLPPCRFAVPAGRAPPREPLPAPAGDAGGREGPGSGAPSPALEVQEYPKARATCAELGSRAERARSLFRGSSRQVTAPASGCVLGALDPLCV